MVTDGLQMVKSIGLGNTAPNSSGVGITFPATQSASSNANTLDDYEEGTWTPSIGGTATYTNQEGGYIKIGRLVFVQAFLNLNTLGTGSQTTISGLPFTVSSAVTAARNQAGSVGYFFGLATNVTSLCCQPIGGSTTLNFPGLTAANSGVTNPVTVFTNGAQLLFSAVYSTDN
jgi:hypothetical protein